MAKKPITLNELQEIFRRLEEVSSDILELGERSRFCQIDKGLNPVTILRSAAFATRDITQAAILLSSAITDAEAKEKLKGFKI